MSAYIGHIAALATSFAWTFTSIFFTLAARRVGSVVVNRTRLLLALFFVMGMHFILRGEVFPQDVEPFRWRWLLLSGVIGFAIGDGFLFQAFIMIGPRLSMLMMALAPVLAALMGWVFLGEDLKLIELAGIGLAVSGIGLVVSSRRDNGGKNQKDDNRQYRLGLAAGFMAAAAQASGFMFSKLGLAGDYPPLSGNVIRLLAGVVSIWLLTIVQRQVRANFAAFQGKPKAILYISIGAFFGPVFGVWLSLIAVQRAPLGIASTLTSLSPILLIPVGYFFFKERIDWRAIAGTLVAIGGIVLLFL